MGAGRQAAPPHPFQTAPTPTRTRNSSEAEARGRPDRTESLPDPHEWAWFSLPVVRACARIIRDATQGVQNRTECYGFWPARGSVTVMLSNDAAGFRARQQHAEPMRPSELAHHAAPHPSLTNVYMNLRPLV